MTTTIQTPNTQTLTAVRAAYWTLVTARTEWVGLAAVRAALPEISRGEMDEALRFLAHQDGFHLSPLANLKALGKADRAAEMEMGGEKNHMISIEGQAPVAQPAWTPRPKYVGRHRAL